MKNRKTVTVILILLLAVMLTVIITSTVRGFRSEELAFRETESIVIPRMVGPTALREDGTLVSTDDRDLSMFTDIVQIVPMLDCIVGLRSDGTLVSDMYGFENSNAAQWRDVVRLDSSDGPGLVAILSDGSIAVEYLFKYTYEYVVYLPDEEYGYVPCDSAEIYDVRSTRVINEGIYFLREDGRIVFWANAQYAFDEYYMLNVDSVVDFELIGYGNILCLLNDGSVTVVGPDSTKWSERLASWQDVLQIEWGYWDCVYGLRPDGRVLVAGEVLPNATPEENAAIAAEIASWENIVELDAYGSVVVALAADGRVYAAGNNDDGQCNVDDWRDVAGIQNYGTIVYGICSDGTVLAAGNNRWGYCNVSHWTDVRLPEGME